MEHLHCKSRKAQYAGDPLALIILCNSNGTPPCFNTASGLWGWLRNKSRRGVWWDSRDAIAEHCRKHGIKVPSLQKGRLKRYLSPRKTEAKGNIIVVTKGELGATGLPVGPITIRTVQASLIGIDSNDEASRWLKEQGLGPTGYSSDASMYRTAP